MPSTGPSPLNAGVDDPSGGGTIAWSNPNNAIASDSSSATVVLGDGDISHYLQTHHATSLSFPPGAVIKGIVVDIDRFASANNHGLNLNHFVADQSVILFQNSTIHSSDRAAVGGWPTAKTRATYGSATDTWGLSWTAAQFPVDSFGVDIRIVCSDDFGTSVTASVDYMQVTVYYSVGGKPPTTQVIYIGS